MDKPPALVPASPFANAARYNNHTDPSDDVASLAATQRVPTQLDGDGSAHHHQHSRLVPDVAALATSRGYSLHEAWGLLVSEHVSHTCTFEKTHNVTVGRSSLCDVVIDDPRVSAVHFTLTLEVEVVTAGGAFPSGHASMAGGAEGMTESSGALQLERKSNTRAQNEGEAATAALSAAPYLSSAAAKGPSSLKVEAGDSEASPTLSSPYYYQSTDDGGNNEQKKENEEDVADSACPSPEPLQHNSSNARSAKKGIRKGSGARRSPSGPRPLTTTTSTTQGGGGNAAAVTAGLTSAGHSSPHDVSRPQPLPKEVLTGNSEGGEKRFTTLASPSSHLVLSAAAAAAPEDRQYSSTFYPNPSASPQEQQIVTVVRVVLEDMSTNGTYINDIRVGKGRRKELLAGDDIAVVRVPEKQSREDRELEEAGELLASAQDEHLVLLDRDSKHKRGNTGTPFTMNIDMDGGGGGSSSSERLTALLARLPATRTYLEHFYFHLYPKAQLPPGAASVSSTSPPDSTALRSLAQTPANPGLCDDDVRLDTDKKPGHPASREMDGALVLPSPSTSSSSVALGGPKHSGSPSQGPGLDPRGFFIPVPSPASQQQQQQQQQQRSVSSTPSHDPQLLQHSTNATGGGAGSSAALIVSPPRSDLLGPQQQGMDTPLPRHPSGGELTTSHSQLQQGLLQAGTGSAIAGSTNAPVKYSVMPMRDLQWGARIGAGASGDVYTGIDVESGMLIAIKVLKGTANIGGWNSNNSDSQDDEEKEDDEGNSTDSYNSEEGREGGYGESESSPTGTHDNNNSSHAFSFPAESIPRRRKPARAERTLSTDEDAEYSSEQGGEEADNNGGDGRRKGRHHRRATTKERKATQKRAAGRKAANIDDTILSISDISTTGFRSPTNITVDDLTPPPPPPPAEAAASTAGGSPSSAVDGPTARSPHRIRKEGPLTKRTKREGGDGLENRNEESSSEDGAEVEGNRDGPKSQHHDQNTAMPTTKPATSTTAEMDYADSAHDDRSRRAEGSPHGNAVSEAVRPGPRSSRKHRHHHHGHTTTQPMLVVERENVRHYVKMPRGLREAHLRELWFLTQLQHHRIVRCLGFQAVKRRGLCILMEYVAGGTLQALVKSFGAFEENVIRLYALQILEGLEYLASRSVVHGDLKSANVLVSERGNVKLTDFGTSKLLRDCNTPRTFRFRRATRRRGHHRKKQRKSATEQKAPREDRATSHRHSRKASTAPGSSRGGATLAAHEEPAQSPTPRGPNDTLIEEEEEETKKGKGRRAARHDAAHQGAKQPADSSLPSSASSHSQHGRGSSGRDTDLDSAEEESTTSGSLESSEVYTDSEEDVIDNEGEDVLEGGGGRVLCGTPLYMSPELIRTQVSTSASDVWALGCVVFEMATGGILPWREVHQADPPTIILHIGRHYDQGPSLEDLYAARAALEHEMRQEVKRKNYHSAKNNSGTNNSNNKHSEKASRRRGGKGSSRKPTGGRDGASADEEDSENVTPSSAIFAQSSEHNNNNNNNNDNTPEVINARGNEEEPQTGGSKSAHPANRNNGSRGETPKSPDGSDSAASSVSTPASPPINNNSSNSGSHSHPPHNNANTSAIPLTPSPMLIDFIQSMFTMDPQRRPRASDLLRHPFITCSTGPQALERWHRSIGDIDLPRQAHFRQSFPAVQLIADGGSHADSITSPLAIPEPPGRAEGGGGVVERKEDDKKRIGSGASYRLSPPEGLKLDDDGHHGSSSRTKCRPPEFPAAPVWLQGDQKQPHVTESRHHFLLSSEDWRTIRAGSLGNTDAGVTNNNNSDSNDGGLGTLTGGALRMGSESELASISQPLLTLTNTAAAQAPSSSVHGVAIGGERTEAVAEESSLVTPPPANTSALATATVVPSEADTTDSRNNNNSSDKKHDPNLPGATDTVTDSAPPTVLSDPSQPDSQPLFNAPKANRPTSTASPHPTVNSDDPQRYDDNNNNNSSSDNTGNYKQNAPAPLVAGVIQDEQQMLTPPLRPSPRTPLVLADGGPSHQQQQPSAMNTSQHGSSSNTNTKFQRTYTHGQQPQEHPPQQQQWQGQSNANSYGFPNYPQNSNTSCYYPGGGVGPYAQQTQQGQQGRRPSTTKLHQDFLRNNARRTLLGLPHTQPTHASSIHPLFPLSSTQQQQQQQPHQQQQQQRRQYRQQQNSNNSNNSVMTGGGEGLLGDTARPGSNVNMHSGGNMFIPPLYLQQQQQQQHGFTGPDNVAFANVNYESKPVQGYSYQSQANTRTMMMTMPPLAWHIAPVPQSNSSNNNNNSHIPGNVAALPSTQPPPLPRSRQPQRDGKKKSGKSNSPPNAFRSHPQQSQHQQQQAHTSPRISPSSLPLLQQQQQQQQPTGLTFDFTNFSIGYFGSNSDGSRNTKGRGDAVGLLGPVEGGPPPLRTEKRSAMVHPQQQQQQQRFPATPVAAMGVPPPPPPPPPPGFPPRPPVSPPLMPEDANSSGNAMSRKARIPEQQTAEVEAGARGRRTTGSSADGAVRRRGRGGHRMPLRRNRRNKITTGSDNSLKHAEGVPVAGEAVQSGRNRQGRPSTNPTTTTASTTAARSRRRRTTARKSTSGRRKAKK